MNQSENGVQISIDPVPDILKKRNIEKGGKVQKYIDSTVVRYCDKYCPMLTGLLKRAIGTVVGSGYVRYNTIYAKTQYYGNAGRGKEGTNNNGLRGRLWFERMKTAHVEDILNNAAQIAGGKGQKK